MGGYIGYKKVGSEKKKKINWDIGKHYKMRVFGNDNPRAPFIWDKSMKQKSNYVKTLKNNYNMRSTKYGLQQ